MSSGLLNRCSGCAYRGRHIYTVGAMRFERELMIDFISTHTAAEWFQAENLEAVPISNQGVPHGLKMILVDTHTLDRADLITLFSSKSWKSHAHNLMVLFNLRHEHEIENLALKSGVRGVLYSDDSVEHLINGICAINSGELWISRRILGEYVQEQLPPQESSRTVRDHALSKRELQLLQVLSSGASNDAIAGQMCISSHTVKTHLHNIFHKINVDSRLQAVLWAKKNL